MITKEYSEPIGEWEVLTEGDCEGRTTTSLGIFTGHIAEIAYSLADKAHYTLTFKKIIPRTVDETRPEHEKVSISLHHESGWWSADQREKVRHMEQLLTKGFRYPGSPIVIKQDGVRVHQLLITF